MLFEVCYDNSCIFNHASGTGWLLGHLKPADRQLQQVLTEIFLKAKSLQLTGLRLYDPFSKRKSNFSQASDLIIARFPLQRRTSQFSLKKNILDKLVSKISKANLLSKLLSETDIDRHFLPRSFI